MSLPSDPLQNRISVIKTGPAPGPKKARCRGRAPVGRNGKHFLIWAKFLQLHEVQH